jgi:hypothetical protein
MGWNDRLADPDAWEEHVDQMLDEADAIRKQIVQPRRKSLYQWFLDYSASQQKDTVTDR